MSALRYSGALRIRVTYLESKPSEVYTDGTPRHPNGSYRCALTRLETGKAGFGAVAARTTIVVGASHLLSHAIDSPEAFDDAARAAISFAADEEREGGWSEAAAYTDANAHVGRSPATAWPKAPVGEVSILSVDAWNSPEGWTWNEWHKIATCDASLCDRKPREILRALRDLGVLGSGSRGLVSVEDDGYNMVILERSNRRPLYAIAYGELQS